MNAYNTSISASGNCCYGSYFNLINYKVLCVMNTPASQNITHQNNVITRKWKLKKYAVTVDQNVSAERILVYFLQIETLGRLLLDLAM